MTEELKPCPFCGGRAIFSDTPKGYRVQCIARSNGCPVNMRTHYTLSRREAIDAWNTRTDAALSALPGGEVGDRREKIARAMFLADYSDDGHANDAETPDSLMPFNWPYARDKYLARADVALAALHGGEKHPDDAAVDRFAAAMKAKLTEARAKGRDGWERNDVIGDGDLARMLIEHLLKGNEGTFEDVANFAMMLHQRSAHPAVLAGSMPGALRSLEAERDELRERVAEEQARAERAEWELENASFDDSRAEAAEAREAKLRERIRRANGINDEVERRKAIDAALDQEADNG